MHELKYRDFSEGKGLNLVSSEQCLFNLREMKTFFQENKLLPPRTGHLADWKSLFRASGTPMDFNSIICQSNLGKPMIVSTNWTESDCDLRGDLVYRPGSVLEDSGPKKLSLEFFDKARWSPIDRSKSYFSPFLRVGEEKAQPMLIEYHLKRFQDHFKKIDFKTESGFFLENRELISKTIADLIHLSVSEKTEKKILANIFSHLVKSDSTFESIKSYQVVNGKIVLNEVQFDSVDELVGKCFLLMKAQVEFDLFKNQPNLLEGHFPLLSGTFIFFIESLLQSDKTSKVETFNSSITHFHWGARNMAGIPPGKKGYIFGSSAQRKLKTLFEATQKVVPQLSTLNIVVLPAALFLLVPTIRQSQDAILLSELFRRCAGTEMNSNQISMLTLKTSENLSAEFLKRLVTKSFFENIKSDHLSKSDLDQFLFPDYFWELPISYLSQIVGEIYQVAVLQFGESL